MCGIFYTNLDISYTRLNKVIALSSRRGPDAQSSMRVGGQTLAHTRLALLDLDPRSNQPFSYKHLVAVFNGEIYNFRSLRASLEKGGYTFSTEGDVEVLLAGYLEYGHKILERLIGMFAFAIYDANAQTVFCARDRLGKKPLFYSFHGKGFTAASSVDQVVTVLQGVGQEVSISSQAMGSFFSSKCTSAPQSIYNGIYSVGAGEYMIISTIDSKIVANECYWDPRHLVSTTPMISSSFDDACNELEGLLSEAVESRLVSDVPVGVLMSGGVDSTLVAALAQKKSAVPIKAFTVAFDDPKYDESGVASRVADSLGLEHHILECRSSDLIDLIEDMSLAYDEPFADSSALPTLLVSKFASQHVKAVMTGDGADEVFLGYNRYSQLSSILPFLSAWQKTPKPVRKGVSHLLNLLPKKLARRVQKVSEFSTVGEFYSALLKTDTSSWYVSEQSPFEDVLSFCDSSLDPISLAGLYDLQHYLLNDINVKIDRASMHFSLEARAPFLDHRVVEYGLLLPKKYKFKPNSKKFIIKSLASRYLPSDITEMRKRGFSIPLSSWFRGELREYVEDQLTPGTLGAINGVDSRAVLDMIHDHMSGKVNAQTDIWKLLVYVAWAQKRR
ncbi:asparagine synthase (glutamine-hydrolyzing) [Vibrio marisflavi]|uniref:asparagine synthase (glutamine-hydrolyzing) n=1 Tax=Vibrio marisflavi CECT 7928 TaxID=634439 RepID=A0ABM9A7Z2_9VIBR|nr:asparagine synthase (glutamine-hydrolyzing) [Vibrio marisflavi]CAH0541754.1 Putative asparagine synthetase [glutamine-hydrolyzing] [Vibrio marisflavi CECT 7928]